MRIQAVCVVCVLLLCAGLFDVSAQEGQFETAADLYQHWMSADDGEGGSPYPDAVCGVWSEDGGMSRLTIAVTGDAAGEAAREEILRLLKNDASVKFATLRYTHAELRAIQEEIVAQFGEEPLLAGCGVHERENVVMVDLNTERGEPDRLMKEYKARYGDRVAFQLTEGYVAVAEDGLLTDATEALSMPGWLLPVGAGLLAAALAVALALRARRVPAVQTTAGTVAGGPARRPSRAAAERAVRESGDAPPEALLAEIKERLDKTE